MNCKIALIAYIFIPMFLAAISIADASLADNNPPDGCVQMNELLSFMDLWKMNSAAYPLREMMQAVGLWKVPC